MKIAITPLAREMVDRFIMEGDASALPALHDHLIELGINENHWFILMLRGTLYNNIYSKSTLYNNIYSKSTVEYWLEVFHLWKFYNTEKDQFVFY